jgi:hypothetical protein
MHRARNLREAGPVPRVSEATPPTRARRRARARNLDHEDRTINK